MSEGLFSDSQKRHLQATFQHIEILLSEALAKLSDDQQEQLFPRYLADASPEQIRAIEQGLREIRKLMRTFCEQQHIDLSERRISSVWAFRCALELAETALADARPGKLAGYGALNQAASAELERILAGLGEVIRRLESGLLSPQK